MTEREFERKMERQYPKEESVKLFRNAYRAGFKSAFNGEMPDSAKVVMEKNITYIK